VLHVRQTSDPWVSALVRLQLHQEMRSTLTTIQRIQEDLRRGVGLPNARCAASRDRLFA
jgi:hypothetical protein